MLAAGGESGQVSLLDGTTLEPVAPPLQHDETSVQDLDFSSRRPVGRGALRERGVDLGCCRSREGADAGDGRRRSVQRRLQP